MDTDANAEQQRQRERERAIQAAADAYERQWISHLRATRPDWEVCSWKDIHQADLIRPGLSFKFEYDLDALAYEKDTNTYHLLKFNMRTGVATMPYEVFGTFQEGMAIMKHLRSNEGKEDRPAGFDKTSNIRGLIGTNLPLSRGTQYINRILDIEWQVLAPEEV
jgi:hypothetical protein